MSRHAPRIAALAAAALLLPLAGCAAGTWLHEGGPDPDGESACHSSAHVRTVAQRGGTPETADEEHAFAAALDRNYGDCLRGRGWSHRRGGPAGVPEPARG